MSTERIDSATHRGWRRWSLTLLVGSGDRIAILTLPFAIAGILLVVGGSALVAGVITAPQVDRSIRSGSPAHGVLARCGRSWTRWV